MSKAVFSIRNISIIISAILLVCYMVFQLNAPKSGPAPGGVNVANFAGPYELVNHLGNTVTEQDLINDYKLIYFGFTYCPAICPTELAKITSVLKALGPDGDAIKPVFISVDPERDTVPVIKDYISLFHPRFAGYTGAVEQVNGIKAAYKVYSAKVDDPDMSEYTVDHSSYIYFMGPDDQLLGLYKIEDSVDKMVSDIQKWLNT